MFVCPCCCVLFCSGWPAGAPVGARDVELRALQCYWLTLTAVVPVVARDGGRGAPRAALMLVHSDSAGGSETGSSGRCIAVCSRPTWSGHA